MAGDEPGAPPTEGAMGPLIAPLLIQADTMKRKH